MYRKQPTYLTRPFANPAGEANVCKKNWICKILGPAFCWKIVLWHRSVLAILQQLQNKTNWMSAHPRAFITILTKNGCQEGNIMIPCSWLQPHLYPLHACECLSGYASLFDWALAARGGEKKKGEKNCAGPCHNFRFYSESAKADCLMKPDPGAQDCIMTLLPRADGRVVPPARRFRLPLSCPPPLRLAHLARRIWANKNSLSPHAPPPPLSSPAEHPLTARKCDCKMAPLLISRPGFSVLGLAPWCWLPRGRCSLQFRGYPCLHKWIGFCFKLIRRARVVSAGRQPNCLHAFYNMIAWHVSVCGFFSLKKILKGDLPSFKAKPCPNCAG